MYSIVSGVCTRVFTASRGTAPIPSHSLWPLALREIRCISQRIFCVDYHQAHWRDTEFQDKENKLGSFRAGHHPNQPVELSLIIPTTACTLLKGGPPPINTSCRETIPRRATRQSRQTSLLIIQAAPPSLHLNSILQAKVQANIKSTLPPSPTALPTLHLCRRHLFLRNNTSSLNTLPTLRPCSNSIHRRHVEIILYHTAFH